MRRYKLDSKEFSEINITPFTDVVLVLLIIFMIASPFIVSGAMKIHLPKSSTAETAKKEKINVTLDEENHIFLDSKPITPIELEAVLTRLVQGNPDLEVTVGADKYVIHENFIKLLDIIRRSGASKLIIETLRSNQVKF